MRITRPSGAHDDVDWAADLTDPRFYAEGDPHAVWRAMRAHAPVHRHRLPDGREYVSVTRYADVRTVIGDHRVFSSRRGNMLSVLGGHDPAADRMMVSSDPPIHTALREPLNKSLSYQRLRAHAPAIRAMARRLMAPLADGETWDVAEGVAAFPMMFTGLLMGLPESDWSDLVRLTATAVAPDDPMYGSDDHRVLAAAHHELFEYFADLAHNAATRDDLVGEIARLSLHDRTIRLDEVIYNCYNVLLGATVTAPHVIAATMVAFAEHPGEYARVTAEPGSVDLAVAEGLRWSSPATHTMRYTNAATEIGGVAIAEGEAVVGWLGSANRDETVFADPYRFDVTRRPNNHLAFGFGRHYCIGAPLARIALGEFFGELVRTAEEIEIAGPVQHLVSNFIGGYTALPMRIRPRDGARPVLAGAEAGKPAT